MTSTIGFIELPLDEVVAAYLDWQRRVHEPLGRTVSARPVSGSLEQVLTTLLPLVNIVRTRELFVPTAGGWTAFFDNGWRGTDAFAPMSYLARYLRCRAMRVTAVENTIEGEFRGARGGYGAVVMEVYGPEEAGFSHHVRSLELVNDGGRWTFDQGGTPFPFEHTECYAARRLRDRFTFEMLEEYLGRLGVRAFYEGFYMPHGCAAMLIEKLGSEPPGMREYSIAEARGE